MKFVTLVCLTLVLLTIPLSEAKLLNVPIPVPKGWTPPVGIPQPGFGLKQVAKADKTDSNGEPYTYYVDSGHPSCDDSNANGFGRASAPRCTIPNMRSGEMTAGDVITVIGPGPYSAKVDAWGVRGTKQNPIYLRGPSNGAAEPPVLTGGIEVRDSSYFVVENMVLEGDNGIRIAQVSDHVVVRRCEHKNKPMPEYCPDRQTSCRFTSVWGVSANSLYQQGDDLSHIVFYGNHIHDNGDYLPTYESGVHALSLVCSLF